MVFVGFLVINIKTSKIFSSQFFYFNRLNFLFLVQSNYKNLNIMKKELNKVVLLIITLVTMVGYSQTDSEPEALGLPGDNFNLFAVLDVFQKSKTLEDFESAINDETNKINNIDLDNDGKIDYIRVISEKEDNSNLIILQVSINGTENQDIAVIEVSKNKSGKIVIQIIGDEELYGKNYIIEPNNKKIAGTPNPGYDGGGTTIINNATNNYNTSTTNNSNYSEVDTWPVIQFMFSPVYVVYRSPYHWGYYPSYWHPWKPIYFHNYWSYNRHYYKNNYYRRTLFVRNSNYYNKYHPRRSHSVIVVNNKINKKYVATYNGKIYKKPVSPTHSLKKTINNKSKVKPATRAANSSKGTVSKSTRTRSKNDQKERRK